MDQKTTLLIIEDHPMFREGLKAIVETDARFKVVGEAGTAKEGLQLARKLKPHLALMDISLSDQSGIRLTQQLQETLPEILVMIVSMHSKMDHIAKAFQAGASGYMVKESASERLLIGLETVSNGEYFLDSAILPHVVEILRRFSHKAARVPDSAYNTLTKREQQIMVLLAEGVSVKDISERLFISPKTVKNHRASIMGKLDVHSSHELMRYAAKIGLIDVDLWST